MKARSHCMMWLRRDAQFLISLGRSCWRKMDRIKLGFCFLLHICLSVNESWAAQKLRGCGGWSSFWDTLFPCSGSTKPANDCRCVEPWACTWVSCTPFPPEAGAIAPGQLHAWCCMCRGMRWLPKHHFSPEHHQALWGKAGGTWKYPMICGLPTGPLWTEADIALWAQTERGHPSFCGKQQNDNSRFLIRRFYKEFRLAHFCRTLLFNCFRPLIKFICQDLLRVLYLRALLLTANTCLWEHFFLNFGVCSVWIYQSELSKV